jgi:hypothetical protein
VQLKDPNLVKSAFVLLYSITFIPMESVMECDNRKSENPPCDTKEGGVFTCVRCRLEERYSYKGKHPPFTKKILFREDSYVMKDPFSPPNKNQLLLLGSDCCLCSMPVCQSQDCSIFYTRRFCRSCAEENLKHFPSAVQIKLKKKPSADNT